MKSIFPILAFILVATNLLSQYEIQTKAYPSLPSESVKVKKDKQNWIKSPGDVVFSETFDGSIGNFTTSGPDAAVWQFDTNGPDGQYSSPTNIDIITSTTAANGFMIFDADLSNPGAAADFVSRSGSLVSPVIDITANPNVLLVFEHDYRHCCSSSFFVAVDVSDNGFNSFTTYNVSEPGFGVNLRPGTIQTEINLSEFFATNPNLSNFQFRFNFDGVSNATSHYYWQVDDVMLVEQYPNELSLKTLWLGDIVNNFEVTETPQDLAGELVVQAAIQNLGIQIPANIRLRTRVVGANFTEFFNNLGGVLSNNFTLINDTITYNTGFQLGTLEVGNYTIFCSIEHDGVDGNTNNNLLTRSFKISQNKLASYNTDQLLIQNSVGYAFGPRNPSGSDDMIVGSIFYLPTTKNITGFDIALSTGRTGFETTFDDDLFLNIWEYKPENPQTSRFEYVAGDFGYTINSSQLTNNGSSFYTFDFQNASGTSGNYTLAGGKYYFAAFNHLGGIGRYLWYWSTLTDDDYSTWIKGPFGVNDAVNWFTIGYDLLIKVNFEMPISETKEQIKEAFNFSLYPNPSSDKTTFHYSLLIDSKVSYKLIDLAGKELITSQQVEIEKGKHQIDISTANLSEGIYSLVFEVNGSFSTHKLVVKK